MKQRTIFKRFTICVLGIVLVCGLFCGALSAYTAWKGSSPAASQYTCTEPYAYPVTPGTPEWDALDSLEARMAASAVPQELLSAMTTEALAETVLQFPFLVNMYAYSDVATGIEMVASCFPGLEELFSRPDAVEALSAYLAEPEETLDADAMFAGALIQYIHQTSQISSGF